MKFSMLAIPALLVLSLTTAAGCQENVKEVQNIAVVDTTKIFEQSTPAQEAEKHLQKVQQALQKGLDDLTALYKGKEKTAEAQRAIAEGYTALQRQMAIERQNLAVMLQQALNTVIRDWRPKTAYTVVISKEALLDSAASVDVTAAVMAEMNKQKLDFPPLPTVTVNPPKEQPKEQPKKQAAPTQKKK